MKKIENLHPLLAFPLGVILAGFAVLVSVLWLAVVGLAAGAMELGQNEKWAMILWHVALAPLLYSCDVPYPPLREQLRAYEAEKEIRENLRNSLADKD